MSFTRKLAVTRTDQSSCGEKGDQSRFTGGADVGLGGRQGVQAAPNKVRFLWLTSPLAGPTWVTHEHSAKPTFQNSSPAFESSLHWTPSLWTGLSIFGSLQLARCLLNWELSSGENLLSTKMAELLRMRMLSSYLAASSRSSTKLPLSGALVWRPPTKSLTHLWWKANSLP